jgi:hypothetical protein
MEGDWEMADLDEVRARVTRLAEPFGVLAEVHEIEGTPSDVSSSGKRVEVIVINKRGLQKSKQIRWELVERADDGMFDEFVEGAARDLAKA